VDLVPVLQNKMNKKTKPNRKSNVLELKISLYSWICESWKAMESTYLFLYATDIDKQCD